MSLNVINSLKSNNNWDITSKKKFIALRQATVADFQKLIDWTSNVDDDWALSLADFEVWQKSFPTASFVAAVDQRSGDTAGFCAGVKHGTDIGFIGMYYVHKDYRGCGVGAVLWKYVTQYLDGLNLCLASVPCMIAKYRDRNSFRCSEDQRIKIACGVPKNFHRLFNMAANNRVSLTGNDANFLEMRTDVGGFKIAKPNERLMNAIFKYDRDVCCVDRKAWCRNWLLNHRAGKSLVAVEMSTRRMSEEIGPVKKFGPQIFGYGQIREVSTNVLKIGPLYADNQDIALELLIRLLAQYPDIDRRTVHASFVASDSKTEQILNDLGFEILSDYYEVLMFTKRDVEFNRAKMFLFSDSEVNFV